MEGKAHHLREAVIGILPRLPFLVQNFLLVLFVPILLLFDNIRKLAKGDDVLLLELAPHQDLIGRTRQMDCHLDLERLGSCIHFCRADPVLSILLGGLIRNVVLGVAKNLAVLSGSCPVMGLVHQQKVDLLFEKSLVLLLDRGRLQILQRDEYNCFLVLLVQDSIQHIRVLNKVF